MKLQNFHLTNVVTGNGNVLTTTTANSWSCILVKIIIVFSTLAAIKAGTISAPLDDASDVPLTGIALACKHSTKRMYF